MTETQATKTPGNDVEELQRYLKYLADEKSHLITRISRATFEYKCIDEEVIVDLLCLAIAKGFDCASILRNVICNFEHEASDFDAREAFEGYTYDLENEMYALTCKIDATDYSRAMRAKRAIAAFTGEIPCDSIWDRGGRRIEICDMLVCVLHFFCNQGRNPAEMLCKAIDVFVSGVSLQLRCDEAESFEKLQTAIHCHLSDVCF